MAFSFDQVGVSKSAPRKALNSEALIIEWLSQIPHGSIIGSHHIQIDVAKWIRDTYGKIFNPDTLNRKFRGIKNEKTHMLNDAGITLKELNLHGKEQTWKVQNAT
tara:strand:- start:1668 stop:1982 length:315 start_codon:yes stop_codon:yes gene_type:complete